MSVQKEEKAWRVMSNRHTKYFHTERNCCAITNVPEKRIKEMSVSEMEERGYEHCGTCQRDYREEQPKQTGKTCKFCDKEIQNLPKHIEDGECDVF